MTLEALDYARVIFEYLQIPQQPAPSDVMVVFGTNDLRVAGFAADLFHRGWAPTVLVTGGVAHQNDLLATGWTRPEAEMYRDVLVERAVPEECILLEPEATNTSENLRFSHRLLQNLGIEPRRVLLVSKPFMQRRVAATQAVVWPHVETRLATWKTSFDDYCTPDLTPERVTHIMMGDLQRVWVYARRGWSAPQEIPDSVLDAYRRLEQLGYTRQLLPKEPAPRGSLKTEASGQTGSTGDRPPETAS